ncbi:arginase family protein [Oribacterium sp. Sow4_G1_1]|uniref:arginase family protein n=1 Tax=Oribacterium sp. Sow4_G1_1 TaxID=3438794 RepID=UPI003F97F6F6
MSATVARTPSSPFTPSILDFTTLSGTTGFCDDAAADEIRRRIADFPARGIHFLDNGNFHYLTRFWCEKISEDFALVVYDHHVDLRKPVFPGLMSCGSWIRDVLLRNSHCRAVLIIGPECAQADIIERELQSLVAEDQPLRASAPVRVCCFTEDDILDGRVARELPHLLDALHLPVYISIDKDVLSRKVLRTNWDQGIMTEAEFRHELDRFAMGPDIHILGVDICGEPAYNACRRLLDDTRDLRRSDGVNRLLLEHYLARVH